MKQAEAERWFGALAAGWHADRFKRLVSVRGGQVDPADERFAQLPLFAPNHIESGSGRLLASESAAEQAAESGKYAVRAGDILYSKIRPALRKVALAPTDGLCSADMYALVPGKSLDAKFLYYLLLSEGFYRYSLLESDRVAMPKINRESLGECPLVFPSRERQRRIADFLDRKTAAIDTLIEKKAAQLATLGRHRRALIDLAVTEGDADPSRSFSTGIRFGRVPFGWTELRVKHVVSFTTSGSRGWAEYYSESGALFLQSGNLDRQLGLDLVTVQRVTPPANAEGARTRVRRGDVLVCITGALTGNVSFVAEDLGEAYVNQHIALLRPIATRIEPELLAYVLASSVGADQFAVSQYGGTKQGLGLQDVRDVAFLLPPLAEQRRIVVRLRERLVTLDAAGRNIESAIVSLREYRQSLITAAVTGQLAIP